MAAFIIGKRFRHLARENVVVRSVLWSVDLVLIGAILVAFKILPVSWASGLGARLGRVIGRMMPGRTKMMAQNLSRVLPQASGDEIARLASDVWANAGSVMAEYPHLGRIGDARRNHLEIDIDPRARDHVVPGKPVVFVGAHLANWEIPGAAMTQLGIRSHAMYAPLSNPWFDKLMLRYRRRMGCETVSRDAGLRPFMSALKAGEAAAMIIDRRVAGGVPIRFFGADKPSSTLPARLALRFDVPLVPVQVERLGAARFRVRFHAPLVAACPEADQDSRARDLTQQIHALFEDWIRARPGEWLCTSKIWPKTVLCDRSNLYTNQEMSELPALREKS